VAFSEQLGSTKPLGTRLWGEPIVLYRDAEGEVVAAKDVCPHRSAPLSVGDVEVRSRGQHFPAACLNHARARAFLARSSPV
jgi:phenylpropionate dioxygenase-like ring-hydroxylating dioxygenase large terminal subunit